LFAIAAVFLIAIALHLRGLGPYSETQLTALYALVLVAFLASLAHGVLAAYGRAGPRALSFELAGDWALITALVYCTGGVGSLFGFLYIVSILHAAARAGSRGTLYASAAAISAYGVVAFGTALGWLPMFGGISAPLLDEASKAFGIQTAACLSVTLLARRLGREVEAGQHELMELGELHQRIVDNVSSGLLSVDRDERISSFNREAERITGYRIDHVLGWSLSQLFPTLDAAVQLPDGGITRAEVPFTARRGDELYLGFSRSILRDARGRPDGAILIFQDLTRVREMEEQLRRSERLSAVGQLATGLAHEIRNPLASLSGAIELLGGDLAEDSDPSSRRLLRIVERETGRLNRLVTDFLSYAGRRPPQRAPVPLRELFEEIRELLESGEHAAMTMVIDVAAGLSANGDADQLRQVFWNLILNAAQAEPPDQQVTVRAYTVRGESGKRIRVEVSDRGAGIADDHLERAFEPFFTTKPQGTGLGLATVHRVIEAHGGELTVASEVGKGTTISVTLDAVAA
jgi:two-component system sensor histidine kinase PilS (NtrC family)